MYRMRPAANGDAPLKAQLLGSGAILNEVLKAQTMLEEVRCRRRRLERDELPATAGTCCTPARRRRSRT
jgi:hypothetical protein